MKNFPKFARASEPLPGGPPVMEHMEYLKELKEHFKLQANILKQILSD